MITLTLPYGSMQTHPAGTMGCDALAIKVNGEKDELVEDLVGSNEEALKENGKICN